MDGKEPQEALTRYRFPWSSRGQRYKLAPYKWLELFQRLEENSDAKVIQICAEYGVQHTRAYRLHHRLQRHLAAGQSMAEYIELITNPEAHAKQQ